MNEELQKYLALAKQIQDYFNEAIAKVTENPHQHNLLNDQFTHDINPNVEYPNAIESIEYRGFGKINVQVYIDTFINALKSNPDETQKILDAHRNILDQVKKFSNLKWKFLKTSSIEDLPPTNITTIYDSISNKNLILFRDTDRNMADSPNDYVALIKIAYTIDQINVALQKYTSSRKKWFFQKGQNQDYVVLKNFINQKMHLIQFEHQAKPDDIKLDMNFGPYFFGIFASTYLREILERNYQPQKKYYIQDLPEEIKAEYPKLACTEKSSVSSHDVIKAFEVFAQNMHYEARSSHLLLTMMEYFDFQQKVRGSFDFNDHKKFIESAHAYGRFLSLSKRMWLEDGKLFYRNGSNRLHSLKRGIANDLHQTVSFYLPFTAYEMKAFASSEFQDTLSGKPQAKIFLHTMSSWHKYNLAQHYKNRKGKVPFISPEQAITEIAKVCHFSLTREGLSEENYEDIFENFNLYDLDHLMLMKSHNASNDSMEMQYQRFELEYMKDLLEWRQLVIKSTEDEYKTFINTKFMHKEFSDEKKAELVIALKDAKHALNDALYLRTQNATIVCDTYYPYFSIDDLKNQSIKDFKHIICRIGHAFDFNPLPYLIHKVKNENLSYKTQKPLDLSKLNPIQQRALSILFRINLIKSISDNELPSDELTLDNIDNCQSIKDLFPDHKVMRRILVSYALLFNRLENILTDTRVSNIYQSYQRKIKLYEQSAIDEEQRNSKKNDKKQTSTDSFSAQNNANGSTQNSLFDEQSVPYKSVYEKHELDYMKRLMNANKKRFQKAFQTSQETLREKLNQRSNVSTAKQNFVYKPQEQTSINEILCKAAGNKLSQNSQALRMAPIKAYNVSNILGSAKAEGQVIQLFIPQNQILKATGTDGYAYANRRMTSARASSGGGALPNGVIKAGPGYVAPMSPVGKAAGAYIGVFVMLPQITKDVITIASPKTKMLKKGAALLDLGFMAGSMWTFTKFIAKKYPKTAAIIMVGTAGEHMWYNAQPLLQELEKGQRGMTIYYTDEKAYLKSGVSCTDGRRVEFLNPTAAKFSILKKENR